MVKGFWEMVALMVPSLTNSSVDWSTSMAITMASCGLERLKVRLRLWRTEAPEYVCIYFCRAGARHVFLRLIHGRGRLAFNVKDLDNLDSGIVGEYILVTFKPLLKLGWPGMVKKTVLPLPLNWAATNWPPNRPPSRLLVPMK